MWKLQVEWELLIRSPKNLHVRKYTSKKAKTSFVPKEKEDNHMIKMRIELPRASMTAKEGRPTPSNIPSKLGQPVGHDCSILNSALFDELDGAAVECCLNGDAAYRQGISEQC
jgi:hypothetical protein